MTTIAEQIQITRQDRAYPEFIRHIPYAQTLGIECLSIGEELLFKLPVKEDNQGNPFLPAIHGGVMGGSMELAATLHVIFTIEAQGLPKVVDFSIDYLRPGRMQDTFIKCDVVRQGRKVVNVSVTAWQTLKSAPIATARVHFLLP